MKWWIVAFCLALTACNREEPASPEASPKPTRVTTPTAPPIPVVTVRGAFGDKARMPSRADEPTIVQVEAAVVDELRRRAPERAGALAAQRVAETIVITLGGGPDDGLLVTVEANARRVERRVPPASHPAEALTNFDHTLGTIFDELELERRPEPLVTTP